MTMTIPVDTKAQLIMCGSLMLEAGLPSRFVADAVETGFRYEGVAELVLMWRDESEADERSAIVADLQELIDDCARPVGPESLVVRLDDLEAVAGEIRAFKDSLRLEVEARGGIGRLAELSGIPQPSLSRFFGSAAMPRRATLLKIARALDLQEVELPPRF